MPDLGQSVPRTITLIWCPACGRDDRYANLKMRPYKHFAEGKECPGTPMRVRYEPVRQQPLRGQSAT